jgi:hypothetical protein
VSVLSSYQEGVVRVVMPEVKRLVTAMVAAASLAACSGGDDPKPTPSIEIALSAATLSLVQGTNGPVTVTLTRAGGFAGDVAIAVTGVPTGISVTPTPATIAAGATSIALTIAAAAAAAPATTPLTITATGTGVTAKTATLSLTVTAAPVPNYTIAVSPTTQSITQGGTATVAATITRSGGFTAAVALTADGLPTGVSAAFAPQSVTGTTSTLTLTAGAAATVGTATVTVHGTATGLTEKTVTFQLTVAAPTPGSYTLAVTPATVPLAQSATATANVALTRTGGFTGAVTFAAEGLPTGVTGAFVPNNTTTDASVLTLTATAAAAVGTSTITVRGTATGQTDKTATFQLTVSAPAGSYTIAVTPATVPLVQSATATANVALTRTGGFAGAVTFAAEGLPTGVTGAFVPNNTTTDASVLTLTATAAAVVGTSTITVRGTATGQTDKTATFQLTVSAPAGGFTLSAAPTTVPVQQGATGTSTVTIARTNNFAGTVNLTATGLPNGVTAAFNPAAATANTSTLTLTATATATIGTATVTIRGNATGLTEQTTTITVNVTAATGGSGNTTWEFCRATNTPIWFAFQDGTGAWTRVTQTGTKFQFNITQPKAGIAYVISASSASIASRSFAARVSADLQKELLLRNRPTRAYATVSSAVEQFSLAIIYGTQAELSGQGSAQCLPGTGKTVNGTVAGVGALQSATVSLGTAAAGAVGGTFQLKNVPDGALDLIAGRSTTSQTTFLPTLDKLIIRRGVNAADNSTLPVLDFGAAEAFDPVQANLTIANLGTDVAFVTSSYFTSAGSGSSGAGLSSISLPGSGPFKYFGVPAAKQAAGDLHVAIAFALASLTAFDQTRFGALYFKDATDRTITLGAALNIPTVSTAATTPYVRFRATAAIQAAYNKNLSLSFTQSNTTVARSVSITATEGYLAGLATYDFTIPDFTGTAGWDNNWGPKVGISTTWTATAVGFTGVGFGTGSPLEGATFSGATRQGTITP